MDFTLVYLREALSNYERSSVCERIVGKLGKQSFTSEVEFVRILDEDEIQFLNNILPDEIKYAFDEQDFIRGNQLNEVYEQLI
ncbi:sporulation protein [Metabacillus sp. HB246100]